MIAFNALSSPPYSLFLAALPFRTQNDLFSPLFFLATLAPETTTYDSNQIMEQSIKGRSDRLRQCLHNKIVN